MKLNIIISCAPTKFNIFIFIIGIDVEDNEFCAQFNLWYS